MEFQLEQWHWWVFTLSFVVCAAMFQKVIFIWLTASTAAVGTLLWNDPQIPIKIQFMLFGIITLVGVIISQYFVGHRNRSRLNKITSDNPDFNNLEQSDQQQEELVGREFTLEEPIINGSGKLNFNNQQWRLRGKNAVAGSKIRIVSIDGIDSTLLQVAPVSSTIENT